MLGARRHPGGDGKLVGLDHQQVGAAAARLRAAHGFGAVLVLRGGLGVTLAGNGAEERPLHLSSEALEIVDASGATDALVATAAAGISAGLAMPVIARLGALAAGIVTGKAGIAVVREEELLDVLRPGHLASRKVCSRAQAAERVERWRRAGCRVGLLVATGGRMLVAGSDPYAALLAQARAWCERLVVALPEIEAGAGTAERLAERTTVDLVTRYAGDAPHDLIRQLRPDVLVQDPDHAPETVAGADLVQEWGGEVRRPPLVPA